MTSQIQLYDNILLIDGREAQVVDLLDRNAFLVDVEVDGDLDTITIYPSQIKEIIK